MNQCDNAPWRCGAVPAPRCLVPAILAPWPVRRKPQNIEYPTAECPGKKSGPNASRLSHSLPLGHGTFLVRYSAVQTAGNAARRASPLHAPASTVALCHCRIAAFPILVPLPTGLTWIGSVAQPDRSSSFVRRHCRKGHAAGKWRMNRECHNATMRRYSMVGCRGGASR